MNARWWMVMVGIVWLSASLSGCSTRAWYEGFQEQQRQDCYKYESRDEVERCLERVNSGSYDKYESERKGID